MGTSSAWGGSLIWVGGHRKGKAAQKLFGSPHCPWAWLLGACPHSGERQDLQEGRRGQRNNLCGKYGRW